MKRFQIILFTVINCLYVSAQEATREISIYSGAGLSTLGYQLSSGSRSGGGGGDFGIGYSFFLGKQQIAKTAKIFRKSWGIHTGIGLCAYNATTFIDNDLMITRGLIDNDLDAPIEHRTFDLFTTLYGYKERQTIQFLNIPVMAEYRKNRYYVMGGVKIGIPVSSKYSPKGMFTNYAYYPEIDNWARTQEFEGFGLFKNRKTNEKIKLGACAMLSLEAGAKWRIGSNLSLYGGAYFDYGVNNILKSARQSFINYPSDNRSDFTTNSMLTVYAVKVKVITAGIKVRLAMNI